MSKNARKVYGIAGGDEKGPKACPKCGCKHVEQASDGARTGTICRNCGSIR